MADQKKTERWFLPAGDPVYAESLGKNNIVVTIPLHPRDDLRKKAFNAQIDIRPDQAQALYDALGKAIREHQAEEAIEKEYEAECDRIEQEAEQLKEAARKRLLRDKGYESEKDEEDERQKALDIVEGMAGEIEDQGDQTIKIAKTA